MVVLLSSGVISCIISSQAKIGWLKDNSLSNPKVAYIINQASRPLLISNDNGSNPGNIISLSYLLEPKVRFRLVTTQNLPEIPDNFSDIFLFDGDSSKKWRSRLENEENYKLEPILEVLWRLKR